MKMLLAGTPTDCTPATISRMISGEEQHAGAPEGLILIPTMSAGPMNLAQAAGSELSLVSSFMPRSIMTLISGCATRLRAIALALETKVMIERGMKELTSESSLPAAWARFIERKR